VLVVGPFSFSFSSQSSSQRECLREPVRKNYETEKFTNGLCYRSFDSVTVPLVSKSEEQQASASNSGNTGAGASTDPRPPQNEAEETRYKEVLDYLVNVGVSTRTTLEEDQESPQYKAANWIAHVDEYQIPLPSGVGVDAADELPLHTRFTERYALAVIYFALGGDSWKYKMQFMEPKDHCEWYQDFVTTTGNILRLGVSECKALGSGLEDKFVHGIDMST
jgi:hypothetical protein